MTIDVFEAVVQFNPWMKRNWNAVFPIIPRTKIFQKSDFVKESPSLVTRRIKTSIKEAKNKRIPLNPNGENSLSAILIKGKFKAQNNTAKSMKKSVFPSFL